MHGFVDCIFKHLSILLIHHLYFFEEEEWKMEEREGEREKAEGREGESLRLVAWMAVVCGVSFSSFYLT